MQSVHEKCILFNIGCPINNYMAFEELVTAFYQDSAKVNVIFYAVDVFNSGYCIVIRKWNISIVCSFTNYELGIPSNDEVLLWNRVGWLWSRVAGWLVVCFIIRSTLIGFGCTEYSVRIKIVLSPDRNRIPQYNRSSSANNWLKRKCIARQFSNVEKA